MNIKSHIKRVVLQYYRLSGAKDFARHIDQDVAWLRLMTRIRIRRSVRVVSSIAAILIVGVLVGSLYHKYGGTEGGGRLSSEATAFLTLSNGVCVNLSDADSSTMIALNKVIDPSVVIPQASPVDNGQIRYDTLVVHDKVLRVLFQDSSSVVIDRHSTLIFPSDFRRSRTVQLIGHAYFTVQGAHEDWPVFRVKVSDVLVEDHGTVFDVTDRGKGIEATLIEGEIEVQNAHGHHAVLSSGQCARCDGLDLKIMEIDPKVYQAWAEEAFYFKAMPLEDVLQELADFYDVSYKVMIPKQKMRDISITGMIKRSKELGPILSKLEKSTGLSLTVENKIIIVR